MCVCVSVCVLLREVLWGEGVLNCSPYRRDADFIGIEILMRGAGRHVVCAAHEIPVLLTCLSLGHVVVRPLIKIGPSPRLGSLGVLCLGEQNRFTKHRSSFRFLMGMAVL